MTLSIPLARLNVLCQTINSTESLEIQLLRLKVSLESYLEIQWNMLYQRMIWESWQSIQWIMNKNDSNNVYKTKQNCAFENISEIFLSRSWRMQTHSNSQCSQSNDLLVIIYELYNKQNIRLILWHIFQRISFYNTKIASYLHSIEECQVVERRDSIPLMSETTIHDICWQKHRTRSKSFVPFTYSQYAVSVHSELWSYETYDNDLTRHQHLKSIDCQLLQHSARA